MGNTAWKLNETQLRSWLDRLIESGREVVAPVTEDGVLLFCAITSGAEAKLEPSGKTRWSPKEHIFPRTEVLYNYRIEASTVQVSDPPGPKRPQVLVGVRPCDAAGLCRLDDIFLGATRDGLYERRRENTTVVSSACAGTDPECFCTAVGGSPLGTAGSDIQLVPLGDDWLLRTLTDKGRALIDNPGADWTEAGVKELGQVEELGTRVSGEIKTEPFKEAWGPELEKGFDSSVWQRAAAHCQSCSVCAYVCPSCACFDMTHEGNAWCGSQCRSWDACTFEIFTRHASGHNPRETKGDRYRQRVLHKFSFASASDDEARGFRCVGCGRCVTACPAGVDIVHVVQRVTEAIREERADAGR